MLEACSRARSGKRLFPYPLRSAGYFVELYPDGTGHHTQNRELEKHKLALVDRTIYQARQNASTAPVQRLVSVLIRRETSDLHSLAFASASIAPSENP